MERRPDRRVAKTKKSIRKAFIELLADKDFNDITIKEIAEVADINRKTFYNYYAGVHELLEEIENDMVSKFEATLSDFDFYNDIRRPKRTFMRLSESVDEEYVLFQKMFASKSNSQIKEKITSVIVEKTINYLHEKYELDREVVEIVTVYVSAGIMAVYQQWLGGEKKMHIDEVSAILANIIECGVGKVLPKKE